MNEFLLPRIGSFAGLLASLEMDQISLSLDRLPPDSDIEAAHDGDGQVEGHHGAQDGHDLIGLHKLDITLFLLHFPLSLNVLPGIDRYDPHDTGQPPG